FFLNGYDCLRFPIVFGHQDGWVGGRGQRGCPPKGGQK
ncbi:MAG: hypothetical protein RL091_291, partial [Verrucomicrobiota bacterium]